MLKEETINYLKSSGMSDEQIRTVVDAFTCGDCISRQSVLDIVRFENKWLFDAGSHNYDTDIAFENIISKVYNLPPVQPKIKTGHWILADEQNKEDVENDNYCFICSECQCSDIHAKGTKVPYCWKCGARMEENNDI